MLQAWNTSFEVASKAAKIGDGMGELYPLAANLSRHRGGVSLGRSSGWGGARFLVCKCVVLCSCDGQCSRIRQCDSRDWVQTETHRDRDTQTDTDRRQCRSFMWCLLPCLRVHSWQVPNVSSLRMSLFLMVTAFRVCHSCSVRS